MSAGPLVGQAASKPGHRKKCVSRPAPAPASHGTDSWRAYQSAPKKAPKNITSEKMNQLMPQR